LDRAACAVDVAGGPSHSIAIALRGSTCATLFFLNFRIFLCGRGNRNERTNENKKKMSGNREREMGRREILKHLCCAVFSS
jgi:hypothetical protein